jgi:hypothetical protein
MYVRLAFSVAAHLNPEIVILDEVLAVGDAVFQKKCFDRMEEMGGFWAAVASLNPGGYILNRTFMDGLDRIYKTVL